MAQPSGTLRYDKTRLDSCIYILLFQVIFHLHGIYSCRFSSAVLAITLLLIQSGYTKRVEKLKIFLVLLGPLMALGSVIVLTCTTSLSSNSANDLLLAFGKNQDVVNLVVMSLTMIITILCLLQIMRYMKTTIT